jgi:hypothetical protein
MMTTADDDSPRARKLGVALPARRAGSASTEPDLSKTGSAIDS